MTDVSLFRALRGIALVAFAAIVIPLTGCAGTEMQRARRGLSTSMQIVQVVDSTFEPRYRAAMARVRSGDVPEDEREAFIRRWNAAGVAVAGTVAALHTAETTLDAIDRGEEGDIAGVFACVGVAFSHLLEALPTVGVELPPSVNLALTIVMSLAGDRCTPANHGSTQGVPEMSEAISVTP